MPSTAQLRSRLVTKLKELFQLDQPDLDFGFYRIMHAKAKQVTDFLEKDLLKVIEDTFGNQAGQQAVNAHAKARQDLEAALGAAALDENGVLNPAFAATPAGETYLRAIAAADAAKDALSAEGEIYDHLHRFFERYYEEGDFISRRYFNRETAGRAAPFAIPYNGEEVKLHWANADQYYIKTGEYFSNFTVDLAKAPEIAGEMKLESTDSLPVHFRLVDAVEGEHGNVKASDATKRFFILHAEDPVGFNEAGELELRFEYRPDPDKPEKSKEGKWQEELRAQATAKLLEHLAGLPQAAAYHRLLAAKVPTEANKDRTLLAKYLHQYTARNTADYFIHKDLGSFLRRELDFYIKNEVMRLDDIENEDAPRVETYLARIKVLRTIARQLIAFVAQLEDFQKKLWLKKKFVVETNYGITVDRIFSIGEDEDDLKKQAEIFKERDWLLAQIIVNDAQREEWEKLYAIHEIEGKASGDLLQAATPGYSAPLTVEFLKSQPFLVLDTRHFSEEFKAKLVESIEGFDEQCDGLLVHSENFQGLTMLRKCSFGEIKSIYLDPPYNLGSGDFCYKDQYRSSSWISFMACSMAAMRKIADDSALIGISIDDNEFISLGHIMQDEFGRSNKLAYAPCKAEPSGGKQKTGIRSGHEYLIIYSNGSNSNISRDQTEVGELVHEDANGPYVKGRELRKWGDSSLREDRPKQFFELKAPDGSIVLPYRNDGKEGRWRWGKDNPLIKEALSEPEVFHWEKTPFDNGIVIDRKNDRWDPFEKIRETHKQSGWGTWLDQQGTNAEGTKALKELFGEKSFSTPKPLKLISWFVKLSADLLATTLDFFAGSGTTGHAVINLNREDNGRRKYILIEMGDHFDTVLKPRIAKVVYSPDWKDGKPVSRDKGISHCFKYVRLESFEDTLNNLRFTEDAERERALAANDPLRRDYTLNYLLDVETRGSQSLLNLDGFSDPTAYTLNVKKPGASGSVEQPVDLIETFNFLIGLRLVHLAAPQHFTATFQRVPDPDLPKGTDTRLQLDGKMQLAPHGGWWFRKVEGWVPKDRENPNNGQKEKVLIVWRNLTGNLEEDNLMLDEWFQKNRLSTRDFEFDTIYVNGSNNLPNLKLDSDTWKVRLLEEEFHKAMWDVSDV
ncbi:MAG: site-specific DNA-methyltransferase [Luteolibacter sp.]|uniref:site-specific DNA-methyltransferase n=1 Tax=Luteolibacter sp. TaxID=1962973 RepID=UPI00326582E9